MYEMDTNKIKACIKNYKLEQHSLIYSLLILSVVGVLNNSHLFIFISLINFALMAKYVLLFISISF